MKTLLVGFLLCGLAIAQKPTAAAPELFVGTYLGTWQSGYGAGAAALSIEPDKDGLKGRIVITGSPTGYKGDALTITVANFADDIMTINFKAKHGHLSGSGIFQKDTFVGDFRFRYMLAIDRGRWDLQKQVVATESPSPQPASH